MVADVGGFAELEGGEHRLEGVVFGVDAVDVSNPNQQRLIADFDDGEAQAEVGLQSEAVLCGEPFGLAAETTVDALVCGRGDDGGGEAVDGGFDDVAEDGAVVGLGHQVGDVVVGRAVVVVDPGGYKLTGARNRMPRSASVPSQVTKLGSAMVGSGATHSGQRDFEGNHKGRARIARH